MQYAINAGNELIVSLLKKHGARLPSSFESDTLFAAAGNGNLFHLSLLSQAGADMTKANYDKVHVDLKPSISAFDFMSSRVDVLACITESAFYTITLYFIDERSQSACQLV